MSVVFVLLPAALVFAAVALVVFVWAAVSGQFDDLHTPGVRILHDDDERAAPPVARPQAKTGGTASRKWITLGSRARGRGVTSRGG